MTVSTTNVSVSYAGNGSTTAFPITYQFGTPADLSVVLVEDSTGVETPQSLTTHYIVAQSASGTGTLTMLTAPATGFTLRIDRDTEPLTQPDSLRNKGAYYPETVEAMFDRVTRQAQDFGGRALRVRAADSGVVDAVLPKPTPGKMLGWNEDGTAIINTDGQQADVAGEFADAAAASAVAANQSANTATEDAGAASASAASSATYAANAAASATAAGLAQDASETARDAAQVAGNIYANTTAGLAATTDGGYFSVPSGNADEYLILYVRTNSTTATEVKRYPARDAIRKLAVKVGVDGSGSSVGSYGDTTPNTSTMTTGFTYGLASATTAPGYLDSFSVRVNAAGSGKIIVYQDQADGTAKVIYVSSTLTAASGVNTFSDPFSGALLPTGSRPHWSVVTTGIPRYVAGGAGSSVVSGNGSTHTVGTSVTITPNSNTIAIAWTLMAASNALADRVTTLESRTAIPLAPTLPLIHTLFPGTSLPSGWFEAGGWTVNDALIGPTSPGWGKYARGGNYTSLARRRLTSRITAGDATGVWGLCADYPTTGGAFAAVDGTAGMLRLYTWGGSTTAGTLVKEVALPGAIVAGRDYLLDVVKDYLSITVTVTDCLTLATATLTSVKATGSPFFHGRAGIMQLSGAAITAKWLETRAAYPASVHTIIIGDSNTEGTLAALSNSPGPYAKQFAALRAEGDVAVAGLAGDTPANYTAYRRARDLLGFTSAKYAIYNLGTNGNSQSAWRTGVSQFISDCTTLGAEPILCTFPPRAGFQTTLDAQNADILGKYFGNIRYIDIAAALTTGNDRVTWDSAYNGDGTHYNAAGHVRVLQQMRVDCPFLFA